MSSQIDNREKWTDLKYEYYTAGRTLFLENQWNAGCLMLGYAIEGQFKHALNEIGYKIKDILYSHDLHLLWKECLQQSLFGDVEVSEDFIEYTNDHFDQRYPSQRHAKIAQMWERDHAMGMAAYVLVIYDHLLIQLDNSLWAQTKDSTSSVGVRAACHATSHASRYFFHWNAPAISRIPVYLEAVRDRYPTHVDSILMLEAQRDKLWDFDRATTRFAPYEVLLASKPAKNYKFPVKVVRDANGRVIWREERS